MEPLYLPINILKPVDDDIWIVDGEVIDFYGTPFTTRMTIVRLENGDLFCHSPIRLTDQLKQQLAALGVVKHLVSPNWIHYAYIPDWAKAFPDTISWASPNVRKRAKKYKVDITFDHDLGESPELPWQGQIDQLIARGSFMHEEVVFFHESSRTLIITDLIENFESEKIPFFFRQLAKLAGILDPDGKAPIDMRFSFIAGRKKLKHAVEKMISWNPEKIILAHGRWHQENAVEELKRAFRWVL